MPARTDFTVIQRLEDRTTLLEARLGSGRTNQIRVHLQALGHPVVGDPAYLADGQTGESQTLSVDAPPLQLHAWKLAFHHPRTNEKLHFEAPLPPWLPPTTLCAEERVHPER